METPKIFSPDLFLHAAAVSGDLEGGFDYFPPSAHGFYPKKIEKRGLKKSNETL